MKALHFQALSLPSVPLGPPQCDELLPCDVSELRQSRSLLFLGCLKLASEGFQVLPQLAYLDFLPIEICWVFCSLLLFHSKMFSYYVHYVRAHGLKFLISITLRNGSQGFIYVLIQLGPLLTVGNRPLVPISCLAGGFVLLGGSRYCGGTPGLAPPPSDQVPLQAQQRLLRPSWELQCQGASLSYPGCRLSELSTVSPVVTTLFADVIQPFLEVTG